MRSNAARRIVTVVASCVFGAAIALSGASAANAASASTSAAVAASASNNNIVTPSDVYPWS